jgi:hypothetical protein
VGNESLRGEIQFLLEGGLKTEVFPRADTHEEVQSIVGRLKPAGSGLKAKLVIGGFTLKPATHGDIEPARPACIVKSINGSANCRSSMCWSNSALPSG